MDRPIIPPDPTHGPACFAPPLDDAKLATYRQLATDCPREDVRDAMLSLLTMVEKFRETPESKLPGVPLQTAFTQSDFHGKKPPMIIPLEQAEVNRMWDYIPWPHEINALAELFATIPQGELRNAAEHLKWFASELALDREPITKDKLG